MILQFVKEQIYNRQQISLYTNFWIHNHVINLLFYYKLEYLKSETFTLSI